MENQKVQEKNLETVIIIKKNGIAVIMMNLPKKLNAMSPKLLRDLGESIDDVANDEAIKAVIISGAGKSFSAGGDVKADIEPLQRMSPTEFNDYGFGQATRIYKVLIEMEKPVIAAINGYAIGAGMELAMCCDIRIAAEDAQLGEFFVKMGLTPEVAPFLLPRLVGLGRAKIMSLLGDTISAKDAEHIGLVDKVVPSNELMLSAEELAMRLANGPKAVGMIKRAINRSLTMSLEESINYIGLMQYQLIHTEDHHEAVRAFLEKRKPIFKGK